MSHAQAAHYRRRAAGLRILAYRLAHAPSMTLHLHATVDTWHGPCAQRCHDELNAARHGIHGAVDELGDRAWRFDRIADELEAAALRADRQRELEAARNRTV